MTRGMSQMADQFGGVAQFGKGCAAAILAVLPFHAAFAEPSATSAAPACLAAAAHVTGKTLVCEHRAWMTDAERAEVHRLTRGYLLDAHCKVRVDVNARLISEALTTCDRTLDFPPQPVSCELQTSGGPLTISGTFAPHVVFKDGAALAASPGLANVTGVNRALAWPVVMYVNRARSITSEMTAMINAYRANFRQRQARN